MPGGEVFVCPVETSAEGTIAFTEFPAMLGGREIRGIRLRFSEGRIVDASAGSEEDFLIDTLDTDEGARRIGELGIGCNPGIDRYMRNVYFDEKMNGTIHLALGYGFDDIGGTNVSAIHWDIVKDLVLVGASSSTARSCRKTASRSPEPQHPNADQRGNLAVPELGLDEHTRRQPGARKRRGHDGRDIDRGPETVPSLGPAFGNDP